MSYIQIVQSEVGTVQSGAELRNNAIRRALSMGDDCQRLTVAPMPANARPRGQAATVISLDPASVAAVAREIGTLAPSAVIIEGQHLLHAIVALRAMFPSLRMIVDFHNIESALDLAIRLGRAPALLRPLARLILDRRYRRAVAADLMAARLAGEVWVCSTLDLNTLRDLGFNGPISVVPNAIPAWCEIVRPDAVSAAGNEVLFVGHLSYPPNRRAITQLCRTIMPRLKAMVPEVQLHVCGRSPHRKIVALLESWGHCLTADPPDLAPLYQKAAVLAVPLREGGGTRIKILEALAVGCPVVATTKAVEGLNLIANVHYCSAESPAGFASALAEIMRHPDKARAMALAASNFVQGHYGLNAMRQSVLGALDTPSASREC